MTPFIHPVTISSSFSLCSSSTAFPTCMSTFKSLLGFCVKWVNGPCPTTSLAQLLPIPRYVVTKRSVVLLLAPKRPGQRCQGIDQTVDLEGLCKALFLNPCWQVMTWWRRDGWIDCVLSAVPLALHLCRHLFSRSSLCPITLCSVFHPPSSPLPLIAWMCQAQDVRLFPSRHCAVWQRTWAVQYITGWHFLCVPPPFPHSADNIKYAQAFLIT